MDGSDRAGDDQTFKVNFTADGLAMLRERVKEKLKEFMGDYTDDTLAEYVVVLLRNGRHKDDARKELNVFLGDDSATFVSWLWDHLSSNIDSYVQQKQSFPDEKAKSKPILNELSGRCNSQQEHLGCSVLTDSIHYREKSSKVSRIHQSKKWKGIAQDGDEIFPIRSVMTNIFHSEGTTHRSNISKRSRSPKPQVQRKQNQDDEHLPIKRESVTHPVIDAPRRLLQFAIRDAVKTVQQSNSKTEPALKRLRSVVSTSTTDSVFETRPRRITSGSRVPSAISMALKAVAEAAEDVTRTTSSSSVFDRLGHVRNITEPVNQLSDTTAAELEVGECEADNQVPELDHSDHQYRSEYDEEFDGDMTMLDKETEMAAADYASDNDDGYDNVDNVSGYGLDTSHSASSANKENKLVMVEYSIAQEPNEISRERRLKDQEPIANSAAISKKIVNISVNVNTWKPPHYQVSRDVAEMENRMAVENSKVSAGNQNVRFPKEIDVSASQNVKEMEHADVQKDSQKPASAPGSCNTGHPLEDGDSRTLFVSNVHFAATKDTLSRHFNKFGDVLKVIIITDAATGQPTGSAFVEFLKKESADLALSLNGTSFMSRILKDRFYAHGLISYACKLHLLFIQRRYCRHGIVMFWAPEKVRPFDPSQRTKLMPACSICACQFAYPPEPLLPKESKVVRRSWHGAAPLLSWPRISRASSFASRLGRMPYPRGMLPGSFRVHFPIKPGARSLQWKREASAVEPSEAAKSLLTSGNNALSPTARSLTYRRTEI